MQQDCQHSLNQKVVILTLPLFLYHQNLQQQLMDKAYPPLQSKQSHDLKLDVRCAVHTELADKDKRARRCVGSSTSRRYV